MDKAEFDDVVRAADQVINRGPKGKLNAAIEAAMNQAERSGKAKPAQRHPDAAVTAYPPTSVKRPLRAFSSQSTA